ncbi:MAG: MipA/OmpV family protein [Pseudomonadota bacterium]
MTQPLYITTTVFLLIPSLTFAEEKEVGWSYEIIAGVEREAAYTGSNVYTSEFGGSFEATYTTPNGTEWSLGTQGLGVLFSLPQNFEAELTLEYEPGRDNADDPILAGFPEMENTWELQGVLSREFGPYSIGVGLQTDILNKGKGTVGFVGVGYETQLSDRLGFSIGADVSWANAEHMTTEVGISPATAAATGLPAYKATGGYKGATIDVGLAYAITDRSTFFVEASVERYGSKMANSPLIKTHGSRTNTSIGMGLGFAF